MATDALIIYVAHIVALLSIVILFRSYKVLPISLKLLAILLSAFVLFQLIAPVIDSLFGSNTRYYKVVLLVYYGITFMLARTLFVSNKNKKIVSWVFGVGFVVIGIQYLISFDDIYKLSDSILVQNFVVATTCLLYYFEMTKHINQKPIFHQWQFLLITGLFLYALVSNTLWIADMIGIRMKNYPYAIRNVNSIVYLIEILLFFWAVKVFISEQKRMKATAE